MASYQFSFLLLRNFGFFVLYNVKFYFFVVREGMGNVVSFHQFYAVYTVPKAIVFREIIQNVAGKT